ncbi:hypothetical protein BC332_15571 [Capsicum chinense]|nr:hypothetical protein BC332_15571 [Capsicum chinense]
MFSSVFCLWLLTCRAVWISIFWSGWPVVRRLLCSARPVVIQTPVNPTASDQDLQQAQLWQLAQRTTALPFGRGAFTLSTTCTLLTEALTVPKLILAGRLPSQQNATVNLDPNVRNIQELKSWPEFHNAVAAGLRLAPPQGKMSRTWILYNKPEEPTVVHAGLLLALGLHGHLRVLTITDIYQYYSQHHTGELCSQQSQRFKGDFNVLKGIETREELSMFQKNKMGKFKFKMQTKKEDMPKGFNSQGLHSKREVNLVHHKPKNESADLFARSFSVIKCGDPKTEYQNFAIPKARRSVKTCFKE